MPGYQVEAGWCLMVAREVMERDERGRAVSGSIHSQRERERERERERDRHRPQFVTRAAP